MQASDSQGCRLTRAKADLQSASDRGSWAFEICAAGAAPKSLQELLPYRSVCYQAEIKDKGASLHYACSAFSNA